MILSVFVIMMIGGLSFANENPEPGEPVLNGFKKEFSNAENVSWDKQDEYDKATFVLSGRRVVAYFTSDGQLEGCVRDIFFDQLPLSVMTAVDKRYSGADILDVREITNGEGTSYRISLQTKKKKLRLKVSPSGSISEVEKLTN